MNKDIKRWVQACIPCQRTNVHRHTRHHPSPFPAPDSRFAHIHIDLAVPVPDATASTLAAAPLNTWVSRFGVPSIITSDRGPQFESALFSRLVNTLGCKRIRTTTYHPASNGLVERFRRQLKVALRAAPETPWPEVIPLALLGIRSTFKAHMGCAVAEMVYGTSLRLPGDLIYPLPGSAALS
ncbi:uncharacterized protein K02A2.6-like [Ornithodoros turicata]|uniref:uncharacterized protein K02A2.6-like n=1 Tax=Ornithodoros turicata TaxID=34597 RepID=UPI0031389888